MQIWMLSTKKKRKIDAQFQIILAVCRSKKLYTMTLRQSWSAGSLEHLRPFEPVPNLGNTAVGLASAVRSTVAMLNQ